MARLRSGMGFGSGAVHGQSQHTHGRMIVCGYIPEQSVK